MHMLRQFTRPMAHDHLVWTLGDLYRYYEETNNTSGRLWVGHSTDIIGIAYDVYRFLLTGLAPTEEVFNTARYRAEVDTQDCL